MSDGFVNVSYSILLERGSKFISAFTFIFDAR